MSQAELTVLKMGSSFLQVSANLSNAVQEIYEVYRQGQKVIVVVSAMGKTTESLIQQSKEVHPNPASDPHAYAELLATGEAHSGCLLSLALQASGISASYLSPYELGIFTEGDPLDSNPVRLDDTKIREAFLHHAVLVVPGFVGLSEDRKVTLLGRGGSDLTAVFLAQKLRAKECILLKDVDGIYDSDPHLHSTARRFQNIVWAKAIRLGGRIVQQKAIFFAENVHLPVRVTSSVRIVGTVIGNGAEGYYTSVSKGEGSAPRRVLLLGLGTVGRGVYDELQKKPKDFDIRGILVRDLEKHKAAGIPEHLLIKQSQQVWSESEYDLVVELIGNPEVSLPLIGEALSLGADVVSANKALISSHGKHLEEVAKQYGVKLLYSAAVGGSVPVLETIDSLLRTIPGDKKIRSISGVVNGTCNFILDQLLQGIEFSEALKQAQDLGFAEADPSLDISGADSAQKLSLLIDKAFGQAKDWRSFSTKGVDNLDLIEVRGLKAQQKTLRLVAFCERRGDAIYAEVEPQILDNAHPLARAKNEENIFLIETEDGRKFELIGKGAGRVPTARSVLADIFSLQK